MTLIFFAIGTHAVGVGPVDLQQVGDLGEDLGDLAVADMHRFASYEMRSQPADASGAASARLGEQRLEAVLVEDLDPLLACLVTLAPRILADNEVIGFATHT